MNTYLSTLIPGDKDGFEFGDFRLEPDGTLLRGGLPVHLTPKELAALQLLLANAGHIVTATQLKDTLWDDVHVSDDSVPRCVSSLRAKIADEDCIQTVYKRGYRLTSEVRRYNSSDRRHLPRLAITPFDTGIGVDESLGRIVAEETAARLTASRPPLVSVLARDSVFTLTSKGLTSQQIGEELKADLVLTGTLNSMTSHFRLRVEMVRVSDGTQIWVEDMLVARDRAAALQVELVERLAFRLGGGLSISLETTAVAGTVTVPDSAAYEVFLRGHSQSQSMERHRIQDGTDLLHHAAELDRNLIPARIDLVNASITQCLYGFMSPAVAAAQVRRAAGSIPDLEIDAPAVLPALGWVSMHVDHDLATALRHFNLASHLPHDPFTTRTRTMFALSRHRFDEARAILQDALAVDPYAPWLHARLAWTHHLSGRARESLEQIERCLALFPGHESTDFYGPVILAYNGHPDRALRLARELIQRSPYFDIASAAEAYALARKGHRDEARETAERLQWVGRERYVSTAFSAAVWLELGDIDAAVAELRAAEQNRCPWFFQSLADPRLESLAGGPEFDRMCGILPAMELEAARSLRKNPGHHGISLLK